MQVERMKVAPDTVAYADGERRRLIVEFAIPGAPTESIDCEGLVQGQLCTCQHRPETSSTFRPLALGLWPCQA